MLATETGTTLVMPHPTAAPAPVRKPDCPPHRPPSPSAPPTPAERRQRVTASHVAAEIKALIKHGKTCNVKFRGGCPKCRKLMAMVVLHSERCCADNCPVPRCKELGAWRKQRKASGGGKGTTKNAAAAAAAVS